MYMSKSVIYRGLLFADTVNGETTFNVVDESEVLVGLLDGDDIWKQTNKQYKTWIISLLNKSLKHW